MTSKPYMTASEVTAALEISAATLYSYVSRGLIRSEPAPQDSRQRRYLAEDVRRLVERKAQRRDPSRAARGALRWGTPVLESALTLITDTSLYYRGFDALELAQQRTLEEVAALFWTGEIAGAPRLFALDQVDGVADLSNFESLSFLQRMQIALTLAADSDLSAFDLRPEYVARTGARILRSLTRAITLAGEFSVGIATTLAQRWQVQHPHLLNAALILCADHELNASSFTARVVASAEANPYAVVLAGLSALSGFKHGGQTRRARAFLREVENGANIQTVIGERLRRGEPVPGFGHVLYPDGDPRARLILKLLGEACPENADFSMARLVVEAVARFTGEAPNLDFGLVTLERVLLLPQDAALVLFALGRTVGWIGHAIEQYSSAALIRPRAEYVGTRPSTID